MKNLDEKQYKRLRSMTRILQSMARTGEGFFDESPTPSNDFDDQSFDQWMAQLEEQAHTLRSEAKNA